MSKQINVALIGNPNTGKTSVFNALTGLNQKVGNYPGITVEKKEGICKLPRGVKAHIIDLPGTYSINPTSLDESIVLKTLQDPENENFKRKYYRALSFQLMLSKESKTNIDEIVNYTDSNGFEKSQIIEIQLNIINGFKFSVLVA